MKGYPTGFWGKLERDETGAVSEWHPVEAHCADVAACTEVLLDRSILGRRLATLAGRPELTRTDIARLSALAALHDIGKYNLGFQRKADTARHDTAGHVAEVLALLTSDYPDGKRLRALLAPELETWCSEGGAFELLVAAISHHGRPVRCGEVAVDPSIWRAAGPLDPFAGISTLFAAARQWFPEAFSSPRSDLPDAPAFQHAFSGLVMLADWLGSDRAIYPFASEVGDRMTFARPTATDAVRHIGLDASFARASLGAELPGFDRISEYVPREAQAKTMSLDRPTQGGIAILESETGSGKTEAALGRFVQLLHGGLVDGMVFALPTRTAATQIQRRVVEAIARAFPDPRDRPPVVLAVPGYLKVDDATGTKLADFRVLWNDNRAEQDHHRGWAAEQPKRYLAGAVVVGTIDQVLLSSLRVGHAHLRATALLRQLLVVDEVHASDAYMNRILEEVLRFHVASGGHAFLMSATLGTHVRQKLEHAALSSRATSGDDSALDAALSTPYPALHIAARGASPTTVAVAAPDRSKRIRIAVQGIADDPLQVAARALDAAQAGALVLVLRNTVNDAVATHIAVEDLARESPLLFRVRNVVTLHHARFAKSDRELLDKAIEERFGKGAPASGGAIVVCTQTVQQSLDLDSDILFTDLAPMDVLLQRFGRVHRHRERDADRPLGFDIAQGVILTGEAPLEESLRPNGEARGKHGVGTVYDKVLVLEATLRTLAAHAELCIPDQNRELVELTTHPQALDEVAHSLGPIWQKHQNTVSGIELAHVGLADLNLVERNKRFGEYSFKRTDLEERIASRLGESDRRAVFAEPRPGPFGEAVRELTIPGWLAREAPPDPDLAPSDVRCDLRTSDGPSSHTVRFAFGPLGFVYDRLGLRREEATPGDDVADA